jgi:hypothetical protein
VPDDRDRSSSTVRGNDAHRAVAPQPARRPRPPRLRQDEHRPSARGLPILVRSGRGSGWRPGARGPREAGRACPPCPHDPPGAQVGAGPAEGRLAMLADVVRGCGLPRCRPGHHEARLATPGSVPQVGFLMQDHLRERCQPSRRRRPLAHRSYLATVRLILRTDARRDASADPVHVAAYDALGTRLARLSARTRALGQYSRATR